MPMPTVEKTAIERSENRNSTQQLAGGRRLLADLAARAAGGAARPRATSQTATAKIT